MIMTLQFRFCSNRQLIFVASYHKRLSLPVRPYQNGNPASHWQDFCAMLTVAEPVPVMQHDIFTLVPLMLT